ncbi:MAG TPA: UTP--glucose-1-phosphate uridylyltransferase GalU [Bauldia sp.]|mgnify:FL=1|nr:UTP--glucose-1-phosphate uridylyltransferase GalU [Bauldia sp.]
MNPLRKAVFPVAGLGTRFLPATKAMPKEMLTLVDRPLIQYVVDEAREAGIEHFILITGRNKGVIADHFDIQFELEATLRERGRTAIIEELHQDLPEPGQMSFSRQQVPLGLGHAVWCARDLVGDEPFAVLLPDMIGRGKPGCLAQMVNVYNETGGNIIGVEECDPALTGQYGIVGVGETMGDAFRITGMVEKPKPEAAPSNLYINGRYILQPEIFGHLARKQTGAGGEIQLTDAMIALQESQSFYGCRFQGRTYDCGSKLGFLTANVVFALDRPDLSTEFAAELRTILDDRKS